jgi:hypothetical protein
MRVAVQSAVQVSGLEDDREAVKNRSNQIVRTESWRLWIRLGKLTIVCGQKDSSIHC